jgi:hypothetical protein
LFNKHEQQGVSPLCLACLQKSSSSFSTIGGFMMVFYSDVYVLPLPEGHKFPITKYRLVRDGLMAEGIL